MLKCNWKQATRLLSSLLLVFLMGCAQDSMLNAPELISKEDNLDFRDDTKECKCYMEVTRSLNAEGGVLWGLNDITGGSSIPVPYGVDGVGTSWIQPITQTQFPLPSPSEELNPPSTGWHMFYLYYESTMSGWENFTLQTTVRCYTQNLDGSETLATTTYHTFRMGDGYPLVAPNGTIDPFTRIFSKQFSCNVLGNGPPQQGG